MYAVRMFMGCAVHILYLHYIIGLDNLIARPAKSNARSTPRPLINYDVSSRNAFIYKFTIFKSIAASRLHERTTPYYYV
jgi:hypothetical protein